MIIMRAPQIEHRNVHKKVPSLNATNTQYSKGLVRWKHSLYELNFFLLASHFTSICDEMNKKKPSEFHVLASFFSLIQMIFINARHWNEYFIFYIHVKFDRILIILMRWDCVSTFSVLLTCCVCGRMRVCMCMATAREKKNRWIICGIQFSKANQLLCEQTNNSVLTLGKICEHLRFICKQNSACRIMNCCDTNVKGWIDETRWRIWLSSDEK